MSVQRLIRMFILSKNGNAQKMENIFFLGIAKMEYIIGLRRFLPRLLTLGKILRLFLVIE